MPLPTLTVDQILALGQRTDEGCLLWPRNTNGLGYGRVSIKGKQWVVHRYIWTELRGPVPDGMTLDHECHNIALLAGTCSAPEGGCLHRRCYELDHLALRSQRDNWLRGNQGGAAIHRAKTHCPKGHPYDESNTSHSRGERRCKTCAREQARLRRTGTTELMPRFWETTCKNGHPWTPESTRITVKGTRRCRICLRDWNRDTRAAKKLRG